MRNNPLLGASYFFRGLGLIWQPGIRRFVIIPLLINTVVFAGLIAYAWTQLQQLQLQVTTWLPDWLDWLSWLLVPLFVVVVLVALVYGFSVVANLIAAPFNGLLAEAVEQRMTKEQSPPLAFKRILKDLVDSLYSEVCKLLYYIARALPLLLLFLIPGLNLAAPWLWLLFSAWMMALEYADYPMGNHGVMFSEQRKVWKNHRGLGLGFGATVLLAFMVPFLNFIVVPTAVAGATALWIEQVRHGARAAQAEAVR